MEERMISGKLISLNKFLEPGQEGMHYVLTASEDRQCTISLGAKGEFTLRVSKDSYIVTISEENLFEIEKISFDESGDFRYADGVLPCYRIEEVLHKEVPCACTVHGYFGRNGYAINRAAYSDGEMVDEFEIHLHKNPQALRIGEYEITSLKGHRHLRREVIERLLMKTYRVKTGDSCFEMLCARGLTDVIEFIEFVTEFDEKLEVEDDECRP